MTRIRTFAGWAFALTICFLVTCPPLSAQTPRQQNDIKSGIATLYARDPIGQSLCFRDGDFGSVFQENEVRNRCSDINFNGYNTDGFTVGVEGSRQGVIIDLGAPADLQKKYGYSETVGNGQGFASLHLKEGKVYVLLDRRARTTQELQESSQLFQKPSSETQAAPVKLGNIYLMRLTDSSEKGFALTVKLVVIAHMPNESVTIRWQVL